MATVSFTWLLISGLNSQFLHLFPLQEINISQQYKIL